MHDENCLKVLITEQSAKRLSGKRCYQCCFSRLCVKEDLSRYRFFVEIGTILGEVKVLNSECSSPLRLFHLEQ